MFEISYWSIHQEWPALFVVCIRVHRITDNSFIIKCIFYRFYWLSTFRFYWQLKIVKVVKDTYLRHLIIIHKTLIKYMCYTTQNSRGLYIFTYLFHSRLVKSQRLMVQVYIWNPSPVMMISQYEFLEWGENHQTRKISGKPLFTYTKRHNSLKDGDSFKLERVIHIFVWRRDHSKYFYLLEYSNVYMMRLLTV